MRAGRDCVARTCVEPVPVGSPRRGAVKWACSAAEGDPERRAGVSHARLPARRRSRNGRENDQGDSRNPCARHEAGRTVAHAHLGASGESTFNAGEGPFAREKCQRAAGGVPRRPPAVLDDREHDPRGRGGRHVELDGIGRLGVLRDGCVPARFFSGAVAEDPRHRTVVAVCGDLRERPTERRGRITERLGFLRRARDEADPVGNERPRQDRGVLMNFAVHARIRPASSGCRAEGRSPPLSMTR